MECSTTEAAGGIVSVGDYKLIGKLGGGKVSAVWKAEHTTTGHVVALKQIHLFKLSRNLRSSLDCEIDFLSTVNHPNIVHLLDILKTEECIFMVFEFCAGGDLRSYIRQHGRVHVQIARKFMQEIGAGLKLLSSHHIIHRDLKPENVLLTSPHSAAVLKIADFGLSRVRHPDDRIETVCGTPLYMAPEILQFQPYDDKVDMWSLGVILFELLHGYPPFRGRTNVQLLRNIQSCTSIPFSDLILPGLNHECIDMCSRLLSINPENRLSFDDFYSHVFLRPQARQTDL